MTEDKISAVRLVIETDKRVTYQQILISSEMGITTRRGVPSVSVVCDWFVFVTSLEDSRFRSSALWRQLTTVVPVGQIEYLPVRRRRLTTELPEL
ncbi:hypothetical protein EVAR_32189_1 [Eumeta japonica]|uniref:Uncharacterized protein n=1 Tax=Eumeta variegata TaxID=151549 RepID=A0A4C1VXV7_EUMVA|nr:hypothetical protein EVAR_32189_1 [Eumeta japonica]